MPNKLIIAVYGRANVGKTSSLRALKQSIESKLTASGTVYTYTDIIPISNFDFRGYFTTGGAMIGISSAGDDLNAVQSGLTVLHQEGCDMIFIGARTKGAGAAYINDFGAANGYEVIWLAKESLYNFSMPWAIQNKHSMQSLMIQHTVETCEAIVHSVYPHII